jgi:hypothetical protein
MYNKPCFYPSCAERIVRQDEREIAARVRLESLTYFGSTVGAALS